MPGYYFRQNPTKCKFLTQKLGNTIITHHDIAKYREDNPSIKVKKMPILKN